jgi:hypothetical protein
MLRRAYIQSTPSDPQSLKGTPAIPGAIFPWGLAFLASAIAVGIATKTALACLDVPGPGIDDAYIFAVYAKHVVEGYGLVYNPGEQPVEGFTSPLWLLPMLGTYLFRIPLESGVLLVACTLTAILLGLAVGTIGSEKGWLSPATLFIGVWILSIPGFVIWNTISLMDTVLLSLGVTSVAIALWRGIPTWIAGGLAAFLVLSRPEGMIWALAFILLDIVNHRARGCKFNSGRTLTLLGIGGATLIALTVWRLSLFGDFLPNTFYAKRVPPAQALRSGVIYFLKFGATYWTGFVALIWGIYMILSNLSFLFRAFRRSDGEDTSQALVRLFHMTGLALLGVSMPLMTGADHFPMARFYQPVWPILGFLLIALVDLRASLLPIPYRLRGLIFCFCMLFPFINVDNWLNLCLSRWDTSPSTPIVSLPEWHKMQMRFEFYLPREKSLLAYRMNLLFAPAPPRVGIVTAGRFRLDYAGPVLDLMGLNHRGMAHSRRWHPGSVPGHVAFNPEVLFRDPPELLLPYDHTDGYGWQLFLRDFQFNQQVLYNLLTSRMFEDLYQLVEIQRKGITIIAFARKDFIRHLVLQGYKVELKSWP